MNAHKNIVAYLLVAALVLAFTPQLCLAGFMDPVAPADYTGSLTSNVGLVTYDGWSTGTTLAWEITDTGSYVKYCYTLTVALKSPSHSIFQVSHGDNPFTDNDLLGWTSGQTDVEISEFISSGTAKPNPYMPYASIYGIKFDSNIDDLVETVCFTSTRMPMWGHFYAADGFLDPDGPHGSDPGEYAVAYNDAAQDYYVPVPDTTVIPIPGALLLGMLGMGAAGMKLRKYA